MKNLQRIRLLSISLEVFDFKNFDFKNLNVTMYSQCNCSLHVTGLLKQFQFMEIKSIN